MDSVKPIPDAEANKSSGPSGEGTEPFAQTKTETVSTFSGNKPAAKSSKPRHPQTAQKSEKKCLSQSLGTTMAESILSPAKDIESMNIVQRLEYMQRETTMASSQVEHHRNNTTVVTTSVTSRDVATHLVDNHIPSQVISTSVIPNMGATDSLSKPQGPTRPKGKKNDIHTFTLEDFAAISALSSLVERYGRVSHMGVLDPSYSFFMSQDRQAALYYKVLNNIAVVGGEPLCSPDRYDTLFEEFRRRRRQRGWGIVLLGATDSFIPYAVKHKWVTMRFGTERVLDPLNNSILQEKEGKRIITQNKQLLDPSRGGISVHSYVPAQGRDEALERRLRHIYDEWREHRNRSSQPQAYMTVFDPFAIPALMIYICTKDQQGQLNGFAALRQIGANKGYHIDPYCALPTAPKGITDLLVFSAMSLLQQAGIGYLSLGFEPSTQLNEVTSLSRPTTAITKSCYRRAFRYLPIGGKKAYHDKFRPDLNLESGLYIVYPEGAPSIQHALATLHFANVKVRELLWRRLSKLCARKEQEHAIVFTSPEDLPVADCISTAHPTWLEESEISNVAVPVQIMTVEHDTMFTPELKAFTNKVIPIIGVAYD
ncbi:uncharacterized protein Z518_02069 [Rhinocladiella mackenziei CBS 650.93]|uniref:Phosphatidylglycerol lysyltransferase C-terminal domain-containing protein n=1 Tax=Rhinocladiella mackenziei CBS 650.93 TaxID=1442369 RepID=A0A0D2IW02_9EURO|nr:uncharacterized protein Z518_02069 [Rhinocladiella mackenziei CBS 650.93]KIX07416.1 hypothetical protein Z518_02069 [Rhinocladiella mackenziei CBS 650.93]